MLATLRARNYILRSRFDFSGVLGGTGTSYEADAWRKRVDYNPDECCSDDLDGLARTEDLAQ